MMRALFFFLLQEFWGFCDVCYRAPWLSCFMNNANCLACRRGSEVRRRRKEMGRHSMAASKIQALSNHPAGPKTSLSPPPHPRPLFSLLTYFLFAWHISLPRISLLKQALYLQSSVRIHVHTYATHACIFVHVFVKTYMRN